MEPWPVVLCLSVLPGAKPQGRWWEAPYLGARECWNEVGISSAGQEGPYLDWRPQPGAQRELEECWTFKGRRMASRKEWSLPWCW